MKMYIYRGLPGSGKTTKAIEIAKANKETIVRVNNDDIRNMLGEYWVPSREKIVSNIIRYSIECALSKGYSVIIDNMNLDDRTVTRLKVLAVRFGAEVEIVEFNTPIEECIRRDSLRENPIGGDKIREIASRKEIVL